MFGFKTQKTLSSQRRKQKRKKCTSTNKQTQYNFYKITNQMPIYFLHMLVHGKVQGVFFRKYTQQKALQIGSINGMVRNLSEDSKTVEVMAFSEQKEALKQLQDWLKTTGSPKSKIESVDVRSDYCDEFVPSNFGTTSLEMRAFQTGRPFAVWKEHYNF